MEEQALAIVEDVIGITDLGEFRWALLRTLKAAVPSDWASLNDVGPAPGDVAALLIPEPPPDVFDVYAHLHEQNPIAAYITRTHDGRASRFSDHVTRAELEALELYQRVYAPMDVHHQIAFTLPGDPGRVLAIVLSRADPDYTDAERDLLNRVRPLLISAFRAASEYAQARPDVVAGLVRAGLTGREADVVALVARGMANAAIAARLGVSDRTVGKHLEHAFGKLGVRTRSAAALLAWDLAQPARRGSVPTLHAVPR